jgi:NhaP-type Na+/H+ or K+/H+ antiporter
MVMRDRVKLAATAGGITGLGIGVISSAAAFSTLLFQSVDDVEAPGFFLLLIPIGLLIGVVLGGLAGRIYRGHDRINPQ